MEIITLENKKGVLHGRVHHGSLPYITIKTSKAAWKMLSEFYSNKNPETKHYTDCSGSEGRVPHGLTHFNVWPTAVALAVWGDYGTYIGAALLVELCRRGG